MEQVTPPWTSRAWPWLALVGVLMAATLAMAMTRVYQVDEAQTVYMAAVLAKGWRGTLFTSGQLHLYPLSLLCRLADNSASMFQIFRVTFWVLFWVNAVLTVKAAGIRLRGIPGLKALALVGTLAPWWAYGLECRHDNLLITGLLILWIVARRLRIRRREAVFATLGFLSLLLHACLFKSVATWAPLALLVILMEPGDWTNRAKMAAWWAGGALVCYAATWAIAAHAGIANIVTDGQTALKVSMSNERFAPWRTLGMLLQTSPLLAAAMGALVIQAGRVLARAGRREAWEADQGFPEALLFLICVLAFFINPTPFPYNLAALAAGAAVAVLVLARPWLEPGTVAASKGLPLAISLGLLLHVTPWLTRVVELFGQSNERQEEVMAMAEAYTGPEDTIFDGIGLIPTRKAPSFLWVIHWANHGEFDQRPLFAPLGERVPPVVLNSYRIGYLPPQDKAYLSANYLAIHKDFWVLGTGPMGIGEAAPWSCQRTGRYAVIALKGGPGSLTLDGNPLPAGFHVISRGVHSLRMDPASPCALAWVGPTLGTLPIPGDDGMATICPVPGGF